MATYNKYNTTTVKAGGDLSADQGKAIAFNDRLLAANGNEAAGVILNKPRAGEHVTVGLSGEMVYRAGAAIAAGAKLSVSATGFFTTVASGGYHVGRNKDSAVTSGSNGTGIFHFAGIYQSV